MNYSTRKEYKESTTANGIAWKEEDEDNEQGTKKTRIQQHNDYREQLQTSALRIG